MREHLQILTHGVALGPGDVSLRLCLGVAVSPEPGVVFRLPSPSCIPHREVLRTESCPCSLPGSGSDFCHHGSTGITTTPWVELSAAVTQIIPALALRSSFRWAPVSFGQDPAGSEQILVFGSANLPGLAFLSPCPAARAQPHLPGVLAPLMGKELGSQSQSAMQTCCP